MTGFEPILADAVRGLTGFVIKAAWDMANVRLDEPVKQLIFRASRQYIQNYNERHGILKVLGMREPVSLESVYVMVQCLDNNALQEYDSIEGLERAYRESKQRRFWLREPKKQPGLDIVNQRQFLMVLGGPGMGKSTFLRKMGLEALKGRRTSGFRHARLPVFVELKMFRSGEIDIRGAIASEFETCGFPDCKRFTTTMLEQGRLLILLDGLDEVPTDRMGEAIIKIQDFVDRYDRNRFIVSCRVAAYRHNFRRFTDVAIADFDDAQIQAFVTNWFHSQPERGQECWLKLMSEGYAATKELTHTPLLLTLICLLYQRAGQFPTSRATLYERALRVLLEEWAAEKELPRDFLYKGLDTKRKELILAEIAHDAFQEDRLFLSKREIVQQIERLLGEMLPDEKFIDGVAVLRSIEVQHGVLVERAEGIYSFSHLTLQEFLTAQHVVEDQSLIEQVVAEHLTDERWREVFVLLAGLKKADHLLLQMQQQAQAMLTPKLRDLLRWADQMTAESRGNFHPAAKRAIAIYLVLILARTLNSIDLVLDRTLAQVRALALDIDVNISLTLDLARSRTRARTRTIDFDLEFSLIDALRHTQVLKDVVWTTLIVQLQVLQRKIADRELSDGRSRVVNERIQEIWLDTLMLEPALVNLTEDEATNLITYLSVNRLMLQCRKSAVRVSSSVWEAIQAQMLRP